MVEPAITSSAPKKLRNPVRIAEIRGMVQLATRATAGVTRLAEGVHRSVWDSMGIPGAKQPGRTRGITGLVYKSVYHVTLGVGKGVDLVLAGVQPFVEAKAEGEGAPETSQRETLVAVLNGVLGDSLAAQNNPLALPMTLRYRGAALIGQALPSTAEATGKVVLLIHGLCMGDLQQQAQRTGQAMDHGQALAAALGYTPIYARYNSGMHISQNGRRLSALLEELVNRWPTPIEDLTIVAHSMGGLVARSAVHYATQDGLRWPDHLKHMVFLGTPHHGAPLERAGNWVDERLGSISHTAPFAALGKVRSAGITDLRYGHVLDVDWQGHDRFQRKPDTRQPVPLPPGVACFTVAATTAAKRGVLADHLIGDGLVPLHSALGEHDDPQRALAFPDSAQWIAYGMSHMDLLRSPDVAHRMVAWLA